MAPATSAMPARDFSGFSIDEMEQMLRPSSRPGAARAPLTARGVLEENRIAAQNRKDENARVKAEVRAQEVALLEIERGSFDDDIIKDRSKNDAARALADHHKAEIARRAEARRRADQAKARKDPSHFPFTDGEKLEKRRKDLARAHAQDLLEQFVTSAPRADPLKPRAVQAYGENAARPTTAPEVHSFNSHYPVFLTKAREHTLRLADPVANRAAAQQRVAAAYEALQRDYETKLAEREGRGFGLEKNDSLSAEAQAASLEERKKNADAIRQQMEEKLQKREEEKKQAREESHGYYGPANKGYTVQQSLAKEHANDLKRQIEVDKARAKDLREYELAQDRIYNESQSQAIVSDQRHAIMREKKSQRVLKESWAQQVKMRQVRAIVQRV